MDEYFGQVSSKDKTDIEAVVDDLKA